MKAALITLLLVSYIAAPALLPASPHDDHDHLDHDHHEHDHDHAHDHGDEYHDHDHDDHDHEEGLNFSPEVLKEFGIELGTVGPGSMNSKYSFPGEIRFNQERVALVSPRLSGTITELHVRLGDKVERGQLLATLESTETLGVFNVVALVAGTVVERGGTLGQTVDAGTMLFIVADTSALWADLRIYLHDIGQLRIGLPVVLESAGATYQGSIDYIAPTIDPHTRTALVRVFVDNSSGHWRPGQFVSATVRMDEKDAALVVPRTALITVEGKTVVFVLSDEGFEVRPIKTGRCDSAFCEVVEGLHHGETIAVRNVISLKAELGKASFGGHHGHVH